MEPPSRTYFLANACQLCKSKNARQCCEVCRMVFYCCPAHRRQDWFEHSKICWAVNKICEASSVEQVFALFDGKNFTKFRHEIATRCLALLGRDLKPWEMEMIYHPRVCDVCREYDWTKLRPCKKCEFVYTCGKNHFRKDHPKWCKVLRLYSDLVIYESIKDKKKINIWCRQSDIVKDVEKTMKEVLEKNNNKADDVVLLEIEKALTSELLTYPLTVLNSLKLTKAVCKSQVTVLFIGAEVQAEVEPVNKWEEYLLHCLPQVEKLKLIFLGPELRANDHQGLKLCDACRANSKELEFQFINGKFYHEYSNESCNPDLICALNSGMYRDFGFKNNNSWKDTIVELFTRGSSPVLITEYTCQELKMDFERIKNLCGNVSYIAQPKMNPYASLKPGLNIISENETPLIFKNYFYVILKPIGSG